MSKSTKIRRATKARKPSAPAGKPDQAAERIREIIASNEALYHPHLADWSVDVKDLPDGEFQILEAARGDDTPARVIATVRPNPELGTPRDRRQIATLLASAPDLWRELRELARWAEADAVEGVETLARITTLLWHSSGDRPFEYRTAPDDDDVAVRLMRRAGHLTV